MNAPVTIVRLQQCAIRFRVCQTAAPHLSTKPKSRAEATGDGPCYRLRFEKQVARCKRYLRAHHYTWCSGHAAYHASVIPDCNNQMYEPRESRSNLSQTSEYGLCCEALPVHVCGLSVRVKITWAEDQDSQMLYRPELMDGAELHHERAPPEQGRKAINVRQPS